MQTMCFSFIYHSQFFCLNLCFQTCLQSLKWKILFPCEFTFRSTQCVFYLIGSGIPLVKHLLWRSIARVREQMRFEPAGTSVSPDLQPSHNERESCLQSDAILATYSYKKRSKPKWHMVWRTFCCEVALHKVVWTSYDAFIDTDYDSIRQDVSHVFCPTVAKITHSLIARVILHMTCMQPVQYVVGYLLSRLMSKEEILQHLHCRCHRTCKPQKAPPPPSANMLHIGEV